MSAQTTKCRCLEPIVFGHTCSLAPDFVREHHRELVRAEKRELRDLAVRLEWLAILAEVAAQERALSAQAAAAAHGTWDGTTPDECAALGFPAPRHPGSITPELPEADEEWLAAQAAELWPEIRAAALGEANGHAAITTAQVAE